MPVKHKTRYVFLSKLDKLREQAIEQLKVLNQNFAQTKSDCGEYKVLKIEPSNMTILYLNEPFIEATQDKLLTKSGKEYSIKDLNIESLCRLTDYLTHKYKR